MAAYTAGFEAIEIAGIVVSVYFIAKFISDLGESIWQILDVMIVNALVTWVLAPLAAFHYFNNNNYLAVLWDKTMRVDAYTYYSFVLPGVLALILGLKWPGTRNDKIKINISQLRQSAYVDRPIQLGYQLIAIGFVATILRQFLPGSLTFVIYLLNKLTLVGLLYLYFSGQKPKNSTLVFGLLLLLLSSSQSGMFGELVYMGLLCTILLSQGSRISLRLKTAIVLLGIVAIVLLQSVKQQYRSAKEGTVGDAGYLVELMVSKINNPNEVLDEAALFGLTVRMNQGWLISATMDNIPRNIPYYNGDPIWQSVLGSVVPRVLWEDKPTSGGAANLKRYLGWELKGTSMNVSPLGEAWANFGWGGGILFMFFYGLFFRYYFSRFLKIMESNPTLIIWIPLIFLYVVVTESDILTSLNHLIKSSFFVYVMYRLYPSVFGLRL